MGLTSASKPRQQVKELRGHLLRNTQHPTCQTLSWSRPRPRVLLSDTVSFLSSSARSATLRSSAEFSPRSSTAREWLPASVNGKYDAQ